VGQFKKQKIKNLENGSNWYIILLIMLLLSGSFIDKCTKSAADNPWSAIGVSIAFLLLLWGMIRWCRKKYLITYPFKMRFSDDSREKIIENIPGLGHESLILKIKLKIERNLEEINIRFVKRKWFGLHYQDVPKNLVSIQKVIDLITEKKPKETGRVFSEKDDSVGGRDGYYNRPYFCPKGGYLSYEIKLNMNPDIKEWHGYISLQHRSGDENRSYGRVKIIIRNV
jgi:hypothetical protein